MSLERRKPVGRSKKTWTKCVEEDLEILGLEESDFRKKNLKFLQTPLEKGKMT